MLHQELINAYKNELRYLHDVVTEFSKSFPKSADALGMYPNGSSDPTVERLLDAIAFLTAKISVQFDNEAVRVAEDVLNTSMPDLMYSLPPTTILQFNPNKNFVNSNERQIIPCNTEVRYIDLKNNDLKFTTVNNVELLPIKVKVLPPPDQERLARIIESSSLNIKNNELLNTLVYRLEISSNNQGPISQSLTNNLPLYFSDDESVLILNQLRNKGFSCVFVNPVDNGVFLKYYDTENISEALMEDEFSLLPSSVAMPGAYRLIREWSHYPFKFNFIDLQNLKEHTKEYNISKFELWFFLSDKINVAEHKSDAVKPFCALIRNVNLLNCQAIKINKHTNEYTLNLANSLVDSYSIAGISEVGYIPKIGEKIALKSLDKIFNEENSFFFTTRIRPKFVNSSFNPSVNFEWQLSTNLNTHEQEEDLLGYIEVKVWSYANEIRKAVKANDFENWRLAFQAPVSSIIGVAPVVNNGPINFPSRGLLRASQFRIETLLNTTSAECAKLIDEWAKSIMGPHHETMLFTGAKLSRSHKHKKINSVLTHVSGIHLLFECSPALLNKNRMLSYVNVIAASFGRQLRGQSFIEVVCMFDRTEVFKNTIWLQS